MLCRLTFGAPRAGQFGPMMAEYVMSWTVAMERKFFEQAELQRSKTWSDVCGRRYRLMSSLTMTFVGCAQQRPVAWSHVVCCGLRVLGAGDIGQHILRLAAAYGMRTVGFRHSGTAIPGVDVVTANLPEALAEADVVVNVLPSTPTTRGVLDGEVLKACRAKQPYFFNVRPPHWGVLLRCVDPDQTPRTDRAGRRDVRGEHLSCA